MLYDAKSRHKSESTQIWSPILVHQYFETVFWYCFTIQASISNSDTVSRNICEGEVDWGTRFWSCLHIVLIVWSFWSSREDACQAHRKRLIGTAEEYIYEDWVFVKIILSWAVTQVGAETMHIIASGEHTLWSGPRKSCRKKRMRSRIWIWFVTVWIKFEKSTPT